ncbi:15034_t:CDS:2 [Acaulospora morrowiae]|uniref:15034_t:CDS:1 n=1 Tax=Acaulospora morrowiae TaxID=94023 RepID=A0A9N8WCG0_9GLOM|nr:15034_t:CDS:2 [Acaulospora morrowiae]
MSRNPTKPVNDLIKFWASQQEESEREKLKASEKLLPKSRPLSPNVSAPSSPQTKPQQPQQTASPRPWNLTNLNNNAPSSIIPSLSSVSPLPPSSIPFGDLSVSQPVSISDRLFSNKSKDVNDENEDSVPDNSFSIIDIQHVPGHKEHGRMDWSLLTQESSSSTPVASFTENVNSSSTKPTVQKSLVKDTSFLNTTRDPPLKPKDPSIRDSLPKVKKVSNLVSKFEQVASPPTSPTALSPINRFNQIPDPLTLDKDPTSPTDGHVKRIQPIIEPLFMSSLKRNVLTDESESTVTTSQPSTSLLSSKEKNKKSTANGIIVNVSSTQTYSTITSPIENVVMKESVVSTNVPENPTSTKTQAKRNALENFTSSTTQNTPATSKQNISSTLSTNPFITNSIFQYTMEGSPTIMTPTSNHVKPKLEPLSIASSPPVRRPSQASSSIPDTSAPPKQIVIPTIQESIHEYDSSVLSSYEDDSPKINLTSPLRIPSPEPLFKRYRTSTESDTEFFTSLSTEFDKILTDSKSKVLTKSRSTRFSEILPQSAKSANLSVPQGFRDSSRKPLKLETDLSTSTSNETPASPVQKQITNETPASPISPARSLISSTHSPISPTRSKSPESVSRDSFSNRYTLPALPVLPSIVPASPIWGPNAEKSVPPSPIQTSTPKIKSPTLPPALPLVNSPSVPPIESKIIDNQSANSSKQTSSMWGSVPDTSEKNSSTPDEPLSQLYSTIWQAMTQTSLDKNGSIRRNGPPAFSDNNRSVLSPEAAPISSHRSNSSGLGFPEPLPKAQYTTTNRRENESTAPSRVFSSTLPSSLNLPLPAMDRDSWGLWGESLNPFKSHFDSKSSTPEPYISNSDDINQDNQDYNPFLDSHYVDQSDLYKVIVGPKGGDKKKSNLLTARDTGAYIMEMQETNIANRKDRNDSYMDKIKGSNEQERSIPLKAKMSMRKPMPSINDTSLSDENQGHAYTIALRKTGSFETYVSEAGSTKKSQYGKRHKFKPVQLPPSPYTTVRPTRNSLSPISTLKNNPIIAQKTSVKYNDHDLPEYASTKSRMSALVPHNLTTTEYRKLNRSDPDLTARYRHNIFNKAFRKNNMTVPDFTRLNSVKERKPDFTMAIMADADLDPSKVTKFSIDPFDESESNQLFKPGAPWIYLPHLDEFIKSLPEAEFSDPKDLMTDDEYEKFILSSGNGKAQPESLFPPMNQIPKDITLDDLKNNKTKSGSKFSLSQASRNDLMATAIDGVLTVQAPYGIKFMKLEIIRDLIQFLALIVTFGSSGVQGVWVNVLLYTIPNLLGLNLDRVFGHGTIFFILFCLMSLMGLYWFRLMTKYDPNADVEGLESSPWSLRPETKRRQNIVLVFILTTLYLPLSKLSIDVLVWSDSFWAVPNPYTDVDNPVFGEASNGMRSPGDFCYVTSMRKDDMNFSPVLIGIALLTLGVFTIWFPIALKRLVDKNLPKTDSYNELGEAVASSEEEYKKLLLKDTCPYNFLYNVYSSKWAAYKTFIMANKFVSILFVVSISKDNCLFRNVPRMQTDIIRQLIQLVLMIILFLFHWKSEPFLYPLQNTGEYWSRIGYVVNSILAVVIAFQVSSIDGIRTASTIISYLFIAVVVWCVVQETESYRTILKKVTKRLDFSLNIYSSKLDFSKHIKKRVWQETWSALLLTSDQFKMPKDKVVAYSQSIYRPPYMLNFMGTVAERHVENLKIIRQIGIRNYTSSMTPLSTSLLKMRAKIVDNYVGPDMYYAPEFLSLKIKTCFGKAYVVPFPFSVVMVYDEDESVVTLTQEWEIARYIQQNENKEIMRRRLVRQMIRALEGKTVIGPCYDGNDADLSRDMDSKSFNGSSNVRYYRGLLQIRRKQYSKWKDFYNMNPGFDVTITYAAASKWNTSQNSSQPTHERVVSHDVLGITTDFQMTPQLEKLFTDNYGLLSVGLNEIQKMMKEYREFYRDEARAKENALSYGFFINIYDNPSIPLESLPALLLSTEENPAVHAIPETNYPSLIYLYERMRAVNISRVHQWWYLFWEDLWRKNHKEISELNKHPQDFSPSYRTSVCYRPMVRLELENFLEKRGCWKNNGKKGFLNSGVLNRVYLYLNNVVFEGSDGKNKRRKSNSKDIEEEKTKRWNITKGNTIDDNSEYQIMQVYQGQGRSLY